MKHKPLIHRADTVRSHDDPSVAVSIDEYIADAAEKLTEEDIRLLVNFHGRIEEMLDLEGVRQHYDLVEGTRSLLAHFQTLPERQEMSSSSKREAAAALLYFLKGVDLIPDSIPEIGFTDDARIVARVLARNPSLRASSV